MLNERCTSVDNIARVQVIDTQKDLPGDLLDDWNG